MKNSNKKSVLLTFDYELFLFQSGTPEKCMFEPTAGLLELLKSNKASATFFLDVLYLWQLERQSQFSTLAKVKEQMARMIAEGHRIELHLHPQWIDAFFHENQWTFGDIKYYRLQDLPSEKIDELFNNGINLLTKAVQTSDANYRVLAFRAGGLCIQPFEPLKDCFQKYNLKIDSSVVHGIFAETPYQKYDFRQAPKTAFYCFEDNPVSENKNGSFVEIPVSVFQRELSDKFYEKSNQLQSGSQISGDGKALDPGAANGEQGLLGKLKTKLSSYPQVYSFDMLQSKLMVKKALEENSDMITFLSHPKLLNQNSFSELERLLGFQEKFDFVNIKTAYDKIAS